MSGLRNISNPDFETIQPLLFRSQQARLAREGLLFAVAWDGTVCGALGAVPEPGALAVCSLYVGEKFRRRGAGAALLDQAEEAARLLNLPALTVSYSCAAEEALAMHTFFLRHGFSMPAAGETLLSLPMASLKDSYFARLPAPSSTAAAHIAQIRKLPTQIYAQYQQRLGQSIPAYLSLQNLPGQVLPKLCLAYWDRDGIHALLTASAVEDHLHLGGAYIAQPSDGRALIALLKTALQTAQEAYPQFETLTVTAATPAGRNLMEKLLNGAAISRQTAFAALRPVKPAQLPLPTGYGGVLARFNSLTQALTARGIPSQLVFEGGALPHLVLEVTQDQSAAFFYEALGGERYEGFRLGAAIELDGQGLPPERLSALCEEAQEAGPAMVYPIDDPPDHIRVHGVWTEEPPLHADAVLDEAILPYLAQARRCITLLAEAP